VELFIGIAEHDRHHFTADLGGDVGGDTMKAFVADVLQAVAEFNVTVMNVIDVGILAAVFNGHEVFINEGGLSFGGQSCHSQTDGSIAATEVEAVEIFIEVEVVEKHDRAFVDTLWRENTPGAMKGQGLFTQGFSEDDILAKFWQISIFAHAV